MALSTKLALCLQYCMPFLYIASVPRGATGIGQEMGIINGLGTSRHSPQPLRLASEIASVAARQPPSLPWVRHVYLGKTALQVDPGISCPCRPHTASVKKPPQAAKLLQISFSPMISFAESSHLGLWWLKPHSLWREGQLSALSSFPVSNRQWGGVCH